MEASGMLPQVPGRCAHEPRSSHELIPHAVVASCQHDHKNEYENQKLNIQYLKFYH